MQLSVISLFPNEDSQDWPFRRIVALPGKSARKQVFEDCEQKLHANWEWVREVSHFLSSQRPLDIVVLTPDELTKAVDEKRLFIRQIFKYGTTLYEASAQ